MPEIKFIAAIDDKNGIAKEQKIPWKIPADQKYFREKLATGPVIMGLKTFLSNGCKPFSTFTNTVFSQQDVEYPGVVIEHDLRQFLDNLHDDMWVAGGGQIFAAAFPYATKLYITRVEGDYGCDVFFPEFESHFRMEAAEPWQQENGYKFQFQTWVLK